MNNLGSSDLFTFLSTKSSEEPRRTLSCCDKLGSAENHSHLPSTVKHMCNLLPSHAHTAHSGRHVYCCYYSYCSTAAPPPLLPPPVFEGDPRVAASTCPARWGATVPRIDRQTGGETRHSELHMGEF